jgi:hypothetical protein
MGYRNSPKDSRLLKHTDMTIHWKALEEHFLMVPLVLQYGTKMTQTRFSTKLGNYLMLYFCKAQCNKLHVLLLLGRYLLSNNTIVDCTFVMNQGPSQGIKLKPDIHKQTNDCLTLEQNTP